jgi:hypothetical protein
MTESFLDRLEAQLVAAEHAMVRTAPGRRAPRRWRASRRNLLVAIAALAVAVPAVAATEPWQPILGRPALHDTPRGTSRTPVPADVLGMLGVLRRRQNDQDRGPVARTLLRSVGQQFSGVRLASVRLVTLSAGHHALVLSAESVGRAASRGRPGVGEPVCLVFPASGLCGPPSALRTTGITMTGGPSVRGLVPDGVAEVILSFGPGRTRSAVVHDNVFWLTGAPTTRRTVPAPPGSGRRRTPPLVMTSGFTVQWLDRHGRVIGPPKVR